MHPHQIEDRLLFLRHHLSQNTLYEYPHSNSN